MVEGKEFRELMLQVVRTRMAFRRSMQRTLKKNNAGITFEMLQILSCLWHEQGITQQVLAERTAKDNEQFREERLRPSERRSRGPEEQTGFPNPGRRRIQKANSPDP